MDLSESVKNILRNADAVCFDVDSTVCTGEGIDDLAEFCGKGFQVKEMYIFTVFYSSSYPRLI